MPKEQKRKKKHECEKQQCEMSARKGNKLLTCINQLLLILTLAIASLGRNVETRGGGGGRGRGAHTTRSQKLSLWFPIFESGLGRGFGGQLLLEKIEKKRKSKARGSRRQFLTGQKNGRSRMVSP